MIEKDETGLISKKDTGIIVFAAIIIGIGIGVLVPIIGKIELEVAYLAFLSIFYDWIDSKFFRSMEVFVMFIWIICFFGLFFFSAWLWMPLK
jgi:hypothetical protein